MYIHVYISCDYIMSGLGLIAQVVVNPATIRSRLRRLPQSLVTLADFSYHCTVYALFRFSGSHILLNFLTFQSFDIERT